MACLSVIKSGTRAEFQPDLVNPFAYRPVDLQQAYNLVAASKGRGKGMTVAIVDGGDDPFAPGTWPPTARSGACPRATPPPARAAW